MLVKKSFEAKNGGNTPETLAPGSLRYKARLGYVVSFMTAWATEWDHVSKGQNESNGVDDE